MWQIKRWIAAAELSQLWSEGCGLMDRRNLCIGVWAALSAGPLVRIRLLWRSPGYRPVKMRPDQREVSLLMLGLPINPSYLQLARKSPLPVPSAEGQAPGMLHPQLTAILSPNTPQRLFFFPLRSSCLLRVLFFPLALSLQGLARLLAWLEGVEKKGFKTHWHASPKSIFGERSFFLWKQKSHREK